MVDSLAAGVASGSGRCGRPPEATLRRLCGAAAASGRRNRPQAARGGGRSLMVFGNFVICYGYYFPMVFLLFICFSICLILVYLMVVAFS